MSQKQRYSISGSGETSPIRPATFASAKSVRVVSALGDGDVIALPDVLVLLRLHSQAVEALLLKLGGKPCLDLVVVGVNHGRAGRKLIAPQHLVHWIGLEARVPTEPQFA
jgi:hypothetical protein